MIRIRDNRRHGRSEVLKRFAGFVESLAHREGRGVIEPNVLDRNDIHIDLPKYGREHNTVTRSQSPRPEAVSMMEQACSFNWELSGQNRPPVDSALTCRLDCWKFN